MKKRYLFTLIIIFLPVIFFGCDKANNVTSPANNYFSLKYPEDWQLYKTTGKKFGTVPFDIYKFTKSKESKPYLTIYHNSVALSKINDDEKKEVVDIYSLVWQKEYKDIKSENIDTTTISNQYAKEREFIYLLEEKKMKSKLIVTYFGASFYFIEFTDLATGYESSIDIGDSILESIEFYK